MERLNDFVQDFREHWDDAYWWADHQLLQTALACTVVGVMGLAFKYAELRMQQSIGAPNV
jgi:hypothetical protein